MNRLYLVRHARTIIDPDRHPSEWQLDPAGASTLQRLAESPCFAGAYRIVSSSEPKALHTADAIGRAHCLPPVAPVDSLRELGKGSFIAQHDETVAAAFQRPEVPAAPGWETAAAALQRIGSAMTVLLAEAAGRDLIVVSHGVLLAIYLAHLKGRSQADPTEWAAIGMPDYCAVETTSMQVVQPFGAWARL